VSEETAPVWRFVGSLTEGLDLSVEAIAVFGEVGIDILDAALRGGLLSAYLEAQAKARAETDATRARAAASVDVGDGMDPSAAILDAMRAVEETTGADILRPVVQALGSRQCAELLLHAASLCEVDGEPVDMTASPSPYTIRQAAEGVLSALLDQAIPR